MMHLSLTDQEVAEFRVTAYSEVMLSLLAQALYDLRIGDNSSGIVLVVGPRPRSSGCLALSTDAHLSEVGQCRAARATLCFQELRRAVHDTPTNARRSTAAFCARSGATPC